MRQITLSFEALEVTDLPAAPTNTMFETGDVLGTGSPQVITGNNSYICLDKVSQVPLVTAFFPELFFGGHIKSWHPTAALAGSGTSLNHRFFQWSNNLGDVFYVRNNTTSRAFELYKNGILQATGTFTIIDLTTLHMEIRVAPAANTIVVRVNGLDDITFVGAIGATVGNVLLSGPGIQALDVSATIAHWFDDIYVNDTSNIDNNNDTTWAGQIFIRAQQLAADGTFQSLTPVPSVPIGSNWTLVDDYDPNDGDVTYIASDNPGNLASFGFANLNLGNVFIKAITPIGVCKTNGPPVSIKMGLYTTGPAPTLQAALPITGSYLNYKARFTKDPLNAAWGAIGNNATSIVIKHDS